VPIRITCQTSVPETLEKLRLRMQATLDEINTELGATGGAITYDNVFLH